MVRQMLLLLLSRCLRGRIWFHNEIFFSHLLVCLFWTADKQSSSLLFCSCYLYECTKECNCFLFKKSNFYFLNM